MLPGRVVKGVGLGCGEQAVEGPGEHRSISGALRVLHPVTSQGLSSLSSEKYHFSNVSQQLSEVQRKGSRGEPGERGGFLLKYKEAVCPPERGFSDSVIGHRLHHLCCVLLTPIILFQLIF